MSINSKYMVFGTLFSIIEIFLKKSRLSFVFITFSRNSSPFKTFLIAVADDISPLTSLEL